MKLTLESASSIVDKALAKAREAKFRPMCVAVLDDGGHVKALKREDGASILRPNIAIGKAWGAVGMGESSRQLGERLKERPAFLGVPVGHVRRQSGSGCRRRIDHGWKRNNRRGRESPAAHADEDETLRHRGNQGRWTDSQSLI